MWPLSSGFEIVRGQGGGAFATRSSVCILLYLYTELWLIQKIKNYNNANTGHRGDGLINMLRAKGEYCVVFKEKIFILV